MDTVTYYSSQNKKFSIKKPFNPYWKSVCHNQPVMEDNYHIFIDEELTKAFGLCRRCGYDSELQNGELFWEVYWRMRTDESASPM